MHDLNADGSVPQVADIRILPVIDQNPNDLNCIYSTLPNLEYLHPLWLKAGNIVHSENLNIVCHLGRFHTMMSFLSSMGSIVAKFCSQNTEYFC